MRGTARIVALLVLAWTSRAMATDPPGGDDKAAAERVFHRGQAHYDAGEYQQAADDFEKAYQLYPHPIFLYNAAQAHRLEGNDERALYFYKVFLQTDPKTALRAEVRQHMAELEKSIAQHPAEPQPTAPPPPSPQSQPQSNIPPQPSPPQQSNIPAQPSPPSAPPPSMPPPSVPTTTTAPATPPPAPPTNNAVTAAPPAKTPVYKKAWLWTLVGGVVVAGVVVGVAVGVTSRPKAGPPAIEF